ncbi:hypothetical protein AN6830.2 [Aspergillus nidulans FGSC A4]|uniref:Uncharacterized protein n=1 Tax=Emericella nidulans (strain FGSC A4 / ATCC 38163 / CBS 112.46 / NRRL 194 / M139) TaxID=227321 RepID=Q5AY00_EMENI|nr:protein lccA [Aspergillus nidulans FGSC A4]EAA58229.1 hypothetical protein AN6830.2 [Aspergillus nidulans FGSC A4]CBF71547.1 TPA: conserved hypothetical protein: laccase (Eurofung) [Aspergillus nidulans FGSC A4]|eukprot:XP_664434.1 hypothetical protein AN6830.2 [Aspergillus nidulans FGSC A4]
MVLLRHLHSYTTTVPETGVIREYHFNLERITAFSDGRERFALVINDSIPGPTIKAVGVIPWSSMSQIVCRTASKMAPVCIFTEWRAMQYGTTWYHSHIGLQAWEGLFGGIVIHGPASENYDKDLGVMFLNYWDISTVDELRDYAQSEGPPTLDNVLINGTNVYGSDEGNKTGRRWNTTFVKSTSYRLRLVNEAVDTHSKFMVDNYTLTVIANDLVPTQPYETTVLDIAMGQRYDVIITADQASVADSFWLRAIPQEACSENESSDNIRDVGLRLHGLLLRRRPLKPHTDGEPAKRLKQRLLYKSESVTLGTNTENLFRWKLNSTSMHVDWTDPILLEIYRNHSVSTFANTSGVVELPKANEWVYVVIETELTVPYPIHLHGHVSVIIAQGTGTYNSSSDNLIDTLGAANLPRRDTAMLKETVYLIVGFYTDNPGAWLMHCHIGWHTEEGLRDAVY